MSERKYQLNLIKKLEDRYPGCVVMKNDPLQKQGIPDLTILHNDRWASLEVKIDEDSHLQPNQRYFVDKMDSMSFAEVIHPGNEDLVLSSLDDHFHI